MCQPDVFVVVVVFDSLDDCCACVDSSMRMQFLSRVYISKKGHNAAACPSRARPLPVHMQVAMSNAAKIELQPLEHFKKRFLNTQKASLGTIIFLLICARVISENQSSFRSREATMRVLIS